MFEIPKMSQEEPPKILTPDEQEAIQENTSGDRLRELARQSSDLAKRVAQNPSADLELLEELSQHSDIRVRQHLAINPNISPQILESLGSQALRYVFKNPALDLLLLENPNLFTGVATLLLCGLLQRGMVDARALEYAASSSEERLQLAVAMHPQASRSILERLAQSHIKSG